MPEEPGFTIMLAGPAPPDAEWTPALAYLSSAARSRFTGFLRTWFNFARWTAPDGFIALCGVVLAVSVFLPWYGLSITAPGAASAQQELASAARQFGNTAFQARANELGAEFGSLAGRRLATVSAHEALKDIGPMLLILAAIALVASLLRLAGVTGLLEAGGGQIALAGSAAALLVLFRMLTRPGAQTNLVSLSLGWGIWLALLSAAAIVAGGFLAASSQTRRRPAAGYYGPQA